MLPSSILLRFYLLAVLGRFVPTAVLNRAARCELSS